MPATPQHGFAASVCRLLCLPVTGQQDHTRGLMEGKGPGQFSPVRGRSTAILDAAIASASQWPVGLRGY